MTRELRCAGCNKYLGTITKGRLLKEISYLCNRCEKTRYSSIRYLKKEADGNSDINDFFNYLMGRGAR